MNKTKLTTVVITAMLIGLTAASIGVAEDVELGGSIKGELVKDQCFGIVEPTLNLTEDQEVDIAVEEEGGNHTVNTTLKIKIERIIEVEKPTTLIFPRGMFVNIRITKPGKKLLADVVYSEIKFIHVAGWLKLGSSADNISLPIKYNVEDGKTSENLTVSVFALGLFPGSVSYTYEPNSILEELLLMFLPNYIGFQQFNVKVNYQYP